MKHPLIARQIEIEQRGRTDGIERYRAAVAERELTALPPGQKLLHEGIARFIHAINEFCATGTNRNLRMREFMQLLPAHVTAFLTMQQCLNSLDGRVSTIATRIGKALEDELNAEAFRAGAPGLFHYMSKKLAKKTDRKQKRDELEWVYKNVPEISTLGWTDEMCTRIGVALLELAADCTGFFVTTIEKKFVQGRMETEKTLQPTDFLRAWLADAHAVTESMRPVAPIGVAPPRDWHIVETHYEEPDGTTSIVKSIDGGYHTKALSRPVMKGPAYRYLLEAVRNGANIDEPLCALNYMQATPFRINEKVLQVVDAMFKSHISKAGLPDQSEMARPAKPCGDSDDEVKAFKEQNPEAWVKWKQQMMDYYAHRFSTARKNSIEEVGMQLLIAKEYAEYPEIFFPAQWDFRGRGYYMPNFINPQGNNISRGLLTFADRIGTPLDDDSAVWLAIHGANCWANEGLDKQDYDTRYAWVMDNEHHILASAADPLNYLWWTDADGGDTAWTFLAFCLEWAAWREHGEGFVSTLPCGSDGSSNGLQHYSLMLLDEITAVMVNLVNSPDGKPADIYAETGVQTFEQIKLACCAEVHPADKSFHKKNDGDEAVSRDQRIALAKMWEEHPIWQARDKRRKLCKSPVMTTPYGVTSYGIREEIWENRQPVFEHFPEELRKSSLTVLVKCLDLALEEIVKPARIGMRFIQDVTKVLVQHNLDLRWTTPDGLPITQHYRKTEMLRIKTTLSGGVNLKQKVVESFIVREAEGTEPIDSAKGIMPEDTLSKARMVNGAAPNFVHACDGTHLRRTMLAMQDHGIGGILAIHDSFAAPAGHYVLMNQLLRQELAQMYSTCQLTRFRDEQLQRLRDAGFEDVDLPPVPPKGNLDVWDVLDAEYAFA